jgi:hypothetical protein
METMYFPHMINPVQFSGCVIRAAGRGMTDEEIEIHRAADRFHPAAG